jgi:hypothetical protein
MPAHHRRLAALAVAALLATPAPALAQSAGDDQYEDPFAGEQQEQTDQGGGEQPAPQPAPAEPTPAPPAEEAPAPEAVPASAQPEPEPGAPELPRTGLDAAPVLAIGTVMLAGGVVLRLRLREHR